MFSRVFFRACLVSLGALVLPASVHANGKWYSALQCRGKVNETYLHSMGTVYSVVPDGSSLHCPFEKHVTRIQSAKIRLFNRNPNQVAACVIVGERVLGTDIFEDSELQQTDLSGPSVQTLNYGAIDPVTAMYYYAECQIPGPHNGLLSHLVAINVTES